MSSIDPLSTVSGIQELATTLSGLGSQLSAAAPTGGFQSVLSQVNAEMEAIEDGGEASVSSTDATTDADDTTASTLGLSAADSTDPDSTSGTEPTGEDVVADAEQYLGVPYEWGGTSATTGFDCSGLVQHVYSDLGISLPRTSEEQATVGTAVDSLADAQPGDLVFFAGSDGTASSPGHVGIYIGNGEMIDAPETGEDVQIQAVGDPTAIRRILPTSSSSDTTSDSMDSLLAAVSGSSSSSGLTTSTGSSEETDELNSLDVPSSLQPLFEQAGSRYGVDPTLLAAVAKQESGFDTEAVSGAGAEGLMQLMPATAAGLGVDPYDAGSAIDGAAQLLSSYLDKYNGSVSLALAAYNAGPGAVSEYGGVPPYSQTENYVSSISSMLSNAESVVA